MENKGILLVEDNSDDELLAVRALKKGKIVNEVTVVRDGAAALDYLFCTGPYHARNPRDLPQVVLLDLNLPKLDGLEVLKRLRADPRTKTLPVVLLTSSKEEKDIASGYTLGANSYVCKPVDLEQFIAAVQQLGLYWVVLNESTVGKS